MKKLIVFFVVMAATAVSMSQQLSDSERVAEGMKPYSPSRLEWLAVELNAMYRTDMTSDTYFSITFISLENSATILILVQYGKEVNRELMNNAVETARHCLNKTIKAQGWGNWVLVREEYRNLSSKKAANQGG